MRRVQKKAEEKQHLERDRFKAKRREKRRRVLSHRKEQVSSRNSSPLVKAKIGRYAGIFSLLVIVFIILQAVLPRPTAEAGGIQQFSFVIEVLYYTLFGYFVYLWLARREQPNAFFIAVATGVALAVLLQGALFLLPGFEPNVQLLIFAVPAAIIGAVLAQLVYSRAT